MITKADVLALAPELSLVSDAQWSSILADVSLQLDSRVWGSWYDMGCKYLAAHLATMTLRKGSGGAVVSEAAGQVSRTYAAAMGSTIKATSYGDEFSRLVAMLAAARGPAVI